MQLHLLKNLFLLSALSSFIGCTWVKPIENASEVALVKPVHVALCNSIGSTRVSVKDGLGPLKRSTEKVSDELTTLAKNSAVSMGGNTVVALSEVVDGGQEFGIYNCQ